ncbi:MAG: hypothetical protein OXB95_03855 [Rhodobacteraceae bacterium]|nr:hypothetical protein [Paracoccaceae bacterium]
MAGADTTLKFISGQVVKDRAGDWWREAIVRFASECLDATIEFTKVGRGSCAGMPTTLVCDVQVENGLRT